MRNSFFIIVLFFLISCEKEIELDLDVSKPELVVDATIENGLPPVVVLSNSLNYFKQINTETIISSYVRNASVIINDGKTDFPLQVDSTKTSAGVLYFYSTNKLLGVSKGTYSLIIKIGTDTYRSSTTIPEITRRIDSIWWERPPFDDDTMNALLMIKATDRPGLGDCIRYFTKVNSTPFLPGRNSVFDDALIDGKTYSVSIDKGVDKNLGQQGERGSFKRGDTITLKLCNIDRQTYDFWRTFEFNYQSIGNPFSSPTKIISNVSGNAIGYFGGYAAQYRTLIIPK
jgi:hypothetical protein